VKSNGEWEGRNTTTKAAVAGGVTFYLENPNYFEMLEDMKPFLYADCGRFEILDDDNFSYIPMLKKAGAYAVKAYL
jgi:hypothetical protein